MGQMSDSEQSLNQFKLYIILLLVNFLGELGQIMTRYDLLGFGLLEFNVSLSQ